MSSINKLPNLFSGVSRRICVENLQRIKTPKTSFRKGKVTGELPTAAVLVPFCNYDNKPSLLYTLRSSDLRKYSGQISFPGGKTDEKENAVDTALRETTEEIGISPDKVEIWGQLPAVPGRDGSIMVTPVIGAIPNLKREDFKINQQEVALAFAVPIEILCNPKAQYHTQYKNGFILPVFVVDEYKIWGLTAYITHIFLHCLLPKDIYKNDWMSQKVFVENTFKSNVLVE